MWTSSFATWAETRVGTRDPRQSRVSGAPRGARARTSRQGLRRGCRVRAAPQCSAPAAATGAADGHRSVAGWRAAEQEAAPLHFVLSVARRESPGTHRLLRPPPGESWLAQPPNEYWLAQPLKLGFIPKNPSPGQRRRSVSDAVLAVSLTECFFHHLHALPSILLWQQDCSTPSCCGNRIAPPNPAVATQSCCGNRIAPPNPAVATGLLHPILLWQQDCPGVSQKTLEAQCCTALRSQTRRPDCAENTGSASVHTDALPDSPPGLPENSVSVLLCGSALTEKLRLRCRKYGISPGLAARLPCVEFGK